MHSKFGLIDALRPSFPHPEELPELVEGERLEGLRETALRVPSSFEASLRSAPQDEGEAQR